METTRHISQPLFSIIIPTHDRPHPLAACLFALSRLTFAKNRMEVIVVDDGGQFPLQPLIDRFRHHLPLIFVRQESAGPAAARNRGASRARGEFLAFTDDDCRPAPAWLTCLQHHLRENPHCVVGGKVVNALPDNAYAAFSQLLLDFLYAYQNRNLENVCFLASCNIALARRQFLASGGFDETYRRAGGEDREFCRRLRQKGYDMVYASKAVVFHAHDLSLTSFCRQQFNYGCGAFHFSKTLRQASRALPWGFYLNLCHNSYAQGRKSRRGFLFITLLFISQLSTAAGFINATKDNKLRHPAIWPVRN